nr:MAG TPA: hypothetical protein [Caudoviricetes sp.]
MQCYEGIISRLPSIIMRSCLRIYLRRHCII